MERNTIYAIIILVAALVGLSLLQSLEEVTGDMCKTAEDCKGVPHMECEGEWICDSGACVWVCDEAEEPQPPELPEESECSSDSDCIVSGCSNQVCGPEAVITTCEWKDEYACLKYSECSCLDGECGWEKTQEYQSCLENL
jgi:eight-cysteine-cluster-containing protein